MDAAARGGRPDDKESDALPEESLGTLSGARIPSPGVRKPVCLPSLVGVRGRRAEQEAPAVNTLHIILQLSRETLDGL